FGAGARVFVLSDSCHSGSVIRTYRELAERAGTQILSGRDTDIGDEPVFRTPTPDIALRIYRENQDDYDSYLKGLPTQKESAAALRARVRLISGCADTQTSLDGTFNGLFTGTMLRVWKEGAFVGDYDRFHKAIVARMPSTQVPQHMVIGAADPIFDAQKPF